MRNILNSEIKNERCNAAALGAYNSAVGVNEQKPGEKANEELSNYIDENSIRKEYPLNKINSEIDFNRALKNGFGGDEKKMQRAYGYGGNDQFWSEKKDSIFSKPSAKYDNVANSKEFKPFADAIKSTSSFEDAYKKVNKIKGVSSQTADKFFNTFANGKRVTSPKEAFRKFYDTIKKKPTTGKITYIEDNSRLKERNSVQKKINELQRKLNNPKTRRENILKYQKELKHNIGYEAALSRAINSVKKP